MATIVVIPQPIRADVDEAAVPHIFTSVTTDPITRVEWNLSGQLEVEFPGDLSAEQMNEVIRLARQEPALADLGGTVTLPPQIVPEEGVTQFAQAVVEQAIIDHLQGRIAVIDELYVARYEPGTSDPAPDSSVLSFSSQDGIKALAPTGEVDASGDPLYDLIMSVPTQAFDEQGNRIAAEFRGRIIAEDITVLQGLVMQGDKDQGFVSKVAPGARLEVGNIISAPETEPSVSFGPHAARWPGAGGLRELGWGLDGGLVVQGRVDSDSSGIDTVHARYINPASGLVDHSVTASSPFRHVAGFTAGANKFYVLAQFRASDPYAIFSFDDSNGTFIATAITTLNQGPISRMAISFEAGRVVLTWRAQSGEIRQRSWNDNMGGGSADSGTGITDSGRVTGSSGEWVAVGNRIHSTVSGTRSWWSMCGTMRGFGQLPSGQYAASNGSGTLFSYNDSKPAGTSTLYTSSTRIHTPTGRETLMSPVAVRGWPARMYATIRTAPLSGGWNDVGIYAGAGTTRTALYQVAHPAGRNQATIDAAPSSGTNPPATSGFGSGGGADPGEVVSQAKDSNGDPLTQMLGDGTFRALRGVAGQAGSGLVSTSVGSNVTHSVVFAQAFASPPVVMVQLSDPGADPQQFDPLTVESVTAGGFGFKVRRIGGSGNVTVSWHAMAATQ